MGHWRLATSADSFILWSSSVPMDFPLQWFWPPTADLMLTWQIEVNMAPSGGKDGNYTNMYIPACIPLEQYDANTQ